MYDNVLFDLDGTLTDSSLGIINSVKFALDKYGMDYDEKNLYKFIGPPLIDSFVDMFGFSNEEARKAIKIYRSYYAEKGIFENHVYPGIEDMLIDLKSAGKRLLVSTSKPEVFAVKILEHFGIAKYFDFIAGSNMDETRAKKCEVIAYALEETGITDKSKTVMVGDREHDIIGAKLTGLDSIAILYGFGNEEEFIKAGATYIAETTQDVVKIVCK